MTDLTLFETGSGGDISLKGNDFDLTGGIFNQIYMALFGGNPDASTTGEELATELRGDWWGNALLSPGEPDLQMNSTLEKTLRSVAISSSGIRQIEDAAKADLAFLSDGAEISVEVTVPTVDKIEIRILAQEPGNLESQGFIFIWSATKQEVIEFRTI